MRELPPREERALWFILGPMQRVFGRTRRRITGRPQGTGLTPAQLQAAITKLPVRQQTQEKVAELLGVDVSTVRRAIPKGMSWARFRPRTK